LWVHVRAALGQGATLPGRWGCAQRPARCGLHLARRHDALPGRLRSLVSPAHVPLAGRRPVPPAGISRSHAGERRRWSSLRPLVTLWRCAHSPPRTCGSPATRTSLRRLPPAEPDSVPYLVGSGRAQAAESAASWW